MIGVAQLVAGRVLNSLPEGLLIAFGAWLLLRCMGRRQNSGTRFGVWMVALAAVVALPIVGSVGFASHSPVVYGNPEFTVPAYWALGFLIFWIVVGSLVLARVVAGVWQVRRLRQSCRLIPIAELNRELQQILQGTRRSVQLLVSAQARVPAAVGFRHPAIVLPDWALDELTTAELKPILIHELAHLRRRDDWTNLAQKAVRAIFFFHPAVWWIDARLSVERELACDDEVLAVTGNARAYAGCLIDLLERGCARRGWTMAQALMVHARDASTRIARILQGGTPKSTRIGRVALGITATVSLACAGVTAVVPSLVGFEPEHTVASASFIEPVADHELRPRQADIFPAAFHPQKPATTAQNELKRDTLLVGTTPKVRNANVRRSIPRRSAAARVVMARYASARTTNRTAEATTLLIVGESAASARVISRGVSRPAAAVLAVNQGAETSLQVMQLIMRDSEGNVQVIRVELLVIVPQQSMQSQSI
ncbi:MAG TPA: M56 family metallopeptidase [Acidobacteriaceae bacterium]|jgi:beta-lactamase regulating signal transducer with metallopeptidase domain|nr:M56 family metallopeptidase [Acidobacteriaceae bacterium]